MKRIRLNGEVAFRLNSNNISNSQSNSLTQSKSQRRNLSTSSSSSNSHSSTPNSDSTSNSTPTSFNKYSSPSRQSSITSQILSAYSLRDDSKKPFTGNDPLAGFKKDRSRFNSNSNPTSHFSYSNQRGKRFTDHQDVYTQTSTRSNGRGSREKGKQSSRDLESEIRMLNLIHVEADPLIMSGMAPDEVNLGDFVEIRMNGIGSQGILLSAPAPCNPKIQTSTHFLLLSTGDLLPIRSLADLTLRFPGYAPSALVAEASPTRREVDEASLSEHPAQEIIIQAQASTDQELSKSDEKKLRARAQLCTLIREIKSCSSSIMLEMETNLRGLLQDSTSSLHSMKTISTRQAASLLLTSRSSSSSFVSLPALLAAHILLISDSKRFSMDPSAHRVSSTFSIRSTRAVKDQESVVHWVRQFNSSDGNGTRGRKILEGFKTKTETIKKWIQETKASSSSSPHVRSLSEYSSSPPPPSITSPDKAESLDSLTFTRDELAIISFVKDFLGNRRKVQRFQGMPELGVLLKYLCDSEMTSNDFHAPKMSDPPSLDPQDLEDYWESMNHASKYGFREDTFHALGTQFLKDIGIFKPWENVANLDNSLDTILEAKVPLVSSLRRGTDGEIEIVDGLEEKRQDFGSSTVYVIDDESAFELDDGISIEEVNNGEGSLKDDDHSGRYWIHIHVADPTSIISPSSEIADFARKRHSAIYLPEKRWALLPNRIVDGIDGVGGVGLAESSSSSTQSQDQSHKGSRTLVFSALVDLTSDGTKQELEIKDVKVQAGWISNVRTLTYEQVGRALSSASMTDASSSISKRELKELQTLHVISRVLSSDRLKSSFGASAQAFAEFSLALKDPLGLNSIDAPRSQFTKPYPHVSSLPNCWTGFPSFSISIPGRDTQASPSFIENRGTAMAQELVAEFMILAGRISGSFATSNSLPMPFRGQEFPSEAQISKLKDLSERHDGNLNHLEWLKAEVELKPGGHRTSAWEHFTMGISSPSSSGKGSIIDNGYIRSTSPLRRYPDLLSHWQLKSQLSSSSSKPPFSKEDLMPMLPDFERLDSKIKSYSRASTRSWFILYLSRLLAFDPQNPMLGPHKAMVVLKGVRTSKDLNANVRVRVLGLGIPAECEWGLCEAPPSLGDEFQVRVKDTIRVGGTMSLVMERV